MDFFLVSVIFFVAGIAKGVLGMGLPTIAMGLLGLMMPVPQAAGLLTLPSLVTNVWQAASGGALRMLLVRLGPMQAGIVVGVAASSWLPAVTPVFSRALLGACLAAYGLSGLAGWRLREAPQRWQGIAGAGVGVATGIVTALTGVFVLPAVAWLQSLRLERAQLAQALGLSFTTSTIALAALLAVRGELQAGDTALSALALLPALAGMLLGQKLRDDLSDAAFRRVFFGGLLLLGAWLGIAAAAAML